MTGVVPLAVSVVLLGASAAGTGHLDLMPLPRSALGAGRAALVRAPDSGVVSNAYAAKDAGGGITAADLAKRGRITGYALDYVVPDATLPQARHALLGVKTMAELYRDPAAATRGLSFWRDVTRKLSGRITNGVRVVASPFRAGVGDGAFAFEITYRLTGQPLYYVGDVVFRSGRLLGSVFVSATDDIGLRARTLQLANSLVSRIRRVDAG
jgi:hypothetical protein